MPRKGVSHRRQLPWSHGSFASPPPPNLRRHVAATIFPPSRGPRHAQPASGSHPSSLLQCTERIRVTPSRSLTFCVTLPLRSSAAVEEKALDPPAPPPLLHPPPSPPSRAARPLSANGREPGHAQPATSATQPHTRAAGSGQLPGARPGEAGPEGLGGATARTRTGLSPPWWEGAGGKWTLPRPRLGGGASSAGRGHGAQAHWAGPLEGKARVGNGICHCPPL